MTQEESLSLKLDLSDLSRGLPAITPAFGATLAEAAAICLSDQEHLPGVELTVEGEFNETFRLFWPEVTDQMRRCWNDQEYTTEQAAYGIALMVVQRLTDLVVVERSIRGTGFDYWLGRLRESGPMPFEKTVRLEVSGIRRGKPSQIRTRVKLKKEQIKPTDNLAPAYIVVVEFSQPFAWVTKR